MAPEQVRKQNEWNVIPPILSELPSELNWFSSSDIPVGTARHRATRFITCHLTGSFGSDRSQFGALYVGPGRESLQRPELAKYDSKKLVQNPESVEDNYWAE
jgi:hypothetical protein